MHSNPTTATREDDVDEAANLVDALFGLVTERRQLSYEERQELRLRVSDRVRELVPYVERDRQEKHLDAHIERMASGYNRAAILARDPSPRTLTKVECDVIAHMLIGRTDDETSEILGVSKAYVSRCALNAVAKLGARNRVHAVARVFAAVTVDEVVGKSSLKVAAPER